MQYVSTRGKSLPVTPSKAIVQGIAPDGGLYVPAELPIFTKEELTAFTTSTYTDIAKAVLRLFLTDFHDDEIDNCLKAAYDSASFPDPPVVLNKPGTDRLYMELYHGPTSAFKDMALQLMPHLFVHALGKNGIADHALILTATSGDTGKAALEGFKNIDGIRVAVFYPVDGVSAIQRQQMITQTGRNLAVAGIRGNFDDAQGAVKEIFADKQFSDSLIKEHMFLSSANSINWGRLVPQIIYYIYTCAQLQHRGLLADGQLADMAVPTGNFGNILAGWIAKRMGAPIGRLICASNANHILTDFIKTGVYDRNRTFYSTTSPSMDILISSNLERLLFLLSGGDGEMIQTCMQSLGREGRYVVEGNILAKIKADFCAGFCDDQQAAGQIRRRWEGERYMMDTHTAVADAVLDSYLHQKQGNGIPVVVSTASPYKFASDVLAALGVRSAEDPFAAVQKLHSISGIALPLGLDHLETKTVHHPDILQKDEIRAWLLEKTGD